MTGVLPEQSIAAEAEPRNIQPDFPDTNPSVPKDWDFRLGRGIPAIPTCLELIRLVSIGTPYPSLTSLGGHAFYLIKKS